MPGLALIANSTRVSAERIAQIRQALSNVKDEVRQQRGDNIRNGVSPVKDSDYNGMRQFPMPLDIPVQGNF
jgi:hypothetical protein